MKEIVLIGGGGHCKSCIEVIDSTGDYIIKGILDLPENMGNLILSYPIIGTDKDISSFIRNKIEFLITVGSIGDLTKRMDLYKLVVSLGGTLATVISSTAYVAKTAKLGVGTIIMHQVFVNASATIGSNCIINSKALIEHDATIGDHCHISTGSIVNGGTTIGDRTFFGSGAVSKQYINIPENSFIKANSIIK
jgi:sugar O-acyltransferase (sialic acid O-acetyltransferase NeuD family)